MSTLICGSFAFDTIMVFPDSFKNHILPDKVHILNVCFLVPEMRREYGGCAGNIAYNLHLLGDKPIPMGTVGRDFDGYFRYLDELNIDHRFVTEIKDNYTAQAFITTDHDDNQIIAFHPGAMNEAHRNKVADAGDIKLAIIAPDGKQGMLDHTRQCHEAGIPFIFDPGQQLPLFSETELKTILHQCRYLATNDYESEVLMSKLDMDIPAVCKEVEAFVITRGGEGSVIHTREQSYDIPVASTRATVDPTGCGDAFRAGILYGITQDMDWQTTGRIASLLGAIKIEHHGTQNHRFNLDEFKDRFANNFGYGF